MQIAGIDLGSRTVKVAVIDVDGRLLEARSASTAFDPLGQGQRLLEGLRYDAIQATGYGRSLFQQATGAPVVSEILAHTQPGSPPGCRARAPRWISAGRIPKPSACPRRAR